MLEKANKQTKKTKPPKSCFFLVQWYRDLVVSLQQLRSLLRSLLWHGNFHMLWVWPKKKKFKNAWSSKETL